LPSASVRRRAQPPDINGLLGREREFRIDGSDPLTLQFAVINVFDKINVIHYGTGIGVFAPQYGQRRGFFGGLAW
jgi:hypothetical protein